MGRQPLLLRRHRASRRLDLAKRDGNEDDVLGRETHAAIERARAEDDLEGISIAAANMGSLMDALTEERNDVAAGVPTGGMGDAEAYVLAAQRQGACAVEVQDATAAVDEEREKYDEQILSRTSLRSAKKLGQFRRVSGATRQRLRDEDAAYKARYAEEGPVRVEDTEEHIVEFGKKQANNLAYSRNRRDRARQGIDRAALPADVVIEFRDGGQLYGVQYNGLEPPPGEKRELYETPEEAFAVATRWREFWDKPRDAVRAAKAERGGVPNVNAHKTKDNLFCVMYCSKHRGKSRFVREPGTGGSWYYDWDAALQLKADYEKSHKGASWFVSAAEVKAADKEAKKRAAAKGAASRKKAKP